MNMLGHMKDRGRLISLLDSFGIAEGPVDGRPGKYEFTIHNDEDGGSAIILGHGQGYSGFECAFEFDRQGNFVGWSIYE